MNRTGILHFAFVGLLAAILLVAARPIAAQGGASQSGIRGYDYKGAYGQFGFAIGQINFDDSDIENDVSGGFTLGGGYRFLPWLAADGNFTFMAGDIEIDNFAGDFDGQAFAFTFGPKFYPLGLFKTEVIPHFIQPYGTIGIGGGEFDIDGRSRFHDRSAFIARFILGVDVWATDHFGFFVEGGGHAADEDDVEGVGLFTIGGQYRF